MDALDPFNLWKVLETTLDAWGDATDHLLREHGNCLDCELASTLFGSDKSQQTLTKDMMISDCRNVQDRIDLPSSVQEDRYRGHYVGPLSHSNMPAEYRGNPAISYTTDTRPAAEVHQTCVVPNGRSDDSAR